MFAIIKSYNFYPELQVRLLWKVDTYFHFRQASKRRTFFVDIFTIMRNIKLKV